MVDTKNPENAKSNDTQKKHSFFGGKLDLKTKDLLDFRYNTQEEIDRLNEEMTTTSDLDDIIKQTNNSDKKIVKEGVDYANENKEEDVAKEKDEENEDNSDESEEYRNEIEEDGEEDKEDDKEKDDDAENETVDEEIGDENNVENENKDIESESGKSTKFFDPFELTLNEPNETFPEGNNEIFDPFGLNEIEDDSNNNENSFEIDNKTEIEESDNDIDEANEEIIEEKDEKSEKNDEAQDEKENIEDENETPEELEEDDETDEEEEDENENDDNIEGNSYEAKNIEDDDEATEDLEGEKENDDMDEESENENVNDIEENNETIEGDENDGNIEEIFHEEKDVEDENETTENLGEEKDVNGVPDITNSDNEELNIEEEDNDAKIEIESSEKEIEDDDSDEENDDNDEGLVDENDIDGDEAQKSEDEIDDESESTDDEVEFNKTSEDDEDDSGKKNDDMAINVQIPVNPNQKDERQETLKEKKIKKNSMTGDIVTEEEVELEQGQDVPNSEDDEEYQPSAEEIFEQEPEFFGDDEVSQQFMQLVQNVRSIFKLERKDGGENPYFKILGGKTADSTLEYLFYLIEEEDEPIDLYIKKIETNQESEEENEHLVQFSYNNDKELNIFVDEVILYEKVNKSDFDTSEYSDTKAILEKFIFLTDNYYDKLKSELDKQREERQKKKQLQQIFKGF